MSLDHYAFGLFSPSYLWPSNCKEEELPHQISNHAAQRLQEVAMFEKSKAE